MSDKSFAWGKKFCWEYMLDSLKSPVLSIQEPSANCEIIWASLASRMPSALKQTFSSPLHMTSTMGLHFSMVSLPTCIWEIKELITRPLLAFLACLLSQVFFYLHILLILVFCTWFFMVDFLRWSWIILFNLDLDFLSLPKLHSF